MLHIPTITEHLPGLPPETGVHGNSLQEQGGGVLHHPVLCPQVLSGLQLEPGAWVVDGTFGRGGHTQQLLSAGLQVIALDRDPEAISYGRRQFPLLELHHAPFSELPAILQGRRPQGILLDLGVSSPQLDQGYRGFSFRLDGPLDMRMDPTTGSSAAELIDQLTEAELADLLYQYGEEKQSRRVARAIVAARPLQRTAQLADVVAKVLPYEHRIHPATRTFQALRIAVNQEMEQLDQALKTFPQLLAVGGKMAVISFHSIEDRKVKERFRELAGVGAPVDWRGQPLTEPDYQLQPSKAIKGEDHDAHPRARSARLRFIHRIR